MSNLGPYLRHNRHHTLLHRQEQPCSQFSLHMYDQQPTIYHVLTLNHYHYHIILTTTSCTTLK
jgi:hypothetical protein